VALALSGVVLAVSTLTIADTRDAAPTDDIAETVALIDSVEAVRGQFYWNSVLTVVGAGLLLLGLTALVQVAGGRRRTAAVGGTLAAIGTIGFVALIASSSMVLHQLTNGSIDSQTAARVWQSQTNSSELGIGIFALPFLVLFPIGFVVLAVALFLGGGVPRWQAVLLGVGAVLAVVAGSEGWLARLLPVVFCVAVTAIGVERLRNRPDPQPEPPGVGAADAAPGAVRR
jgi:hypothetical protein